MTAIDAGITADIILINDILSRNFTATDIKNHGWEILDQLWYEFTYNGARVIEGGKEGK